MRRPVSKSEAKRAQIARRRQVLNALSTLEEVGD
jgi:hypothetical protein